MAETPGECAYQYCTEPQSEQVYYLCADHYQQAWDAVLSKPPIKGRKRVRESGLKPYVCIRGHHVDPADFTALMGKRSAYCRACTYMRNKARRNGITDPDALQALADEAYQQILAKIEKDKR